MEGERLTSNDDLLYELIGFTWRRDSVDHEYLATAEDFFEETSSKPQLSFVPHQKMRVTKDSLKLPPQSKHIALLKPTLPKLLWDIRLGSASGRLTHPSIYFETAKSEPSSPAIG